MRAVRRHPPHASLGLGGARWFLYGLTVFNATPILETPGYMIAVLRSINRVDTRDDGFVNFDSFLSALSIVEGRTTPHIDAYDAASADPSLKIAKIGALRYIKGDD